MDAAKEPPAKVVLFFETKDLKKVLLIIIFAIT